MILVVNVREILQRWAGAKMLHRIPRNKFDIGFGYRVFTSEKGPRPDAIRAGVRRRECPISVRAMRRCRCRLNFEKFFVLGETILPVNLG